jgi:hypothetical protein
MERNAVSRFIFCSNLEMKNDDVWVLVIYRKGRAASTQHAQIDGLGLAECVILRWVLFAHFLLEAYHFLVRQR